MKCVLQIFILLATGELVYVVFWEMQVTWHSVKMPLARNSDRSWRHLYLLQPSTPTTCYHSVHSEVKGVGRRTTQILDDLRNRRAKGGSWRSKKMETTVYHSNISIFHNSLDLVISSILNNDNNHNNNNILIFKLLERIREEISVCLKSTYFLANKILIFQ